MKEELRCLLKNFGLRSRKNKDFVDFNLVGPFSQAPTDFGMQDKNEAKLKSDLRKQVDREEYSDRRTEEQKEYLADEMFHEEHPYRDYGGLRSRKYTPNRLIQEFEKITHPQYLIGLMKRILRQRLMIYVLFMLEEFIIGIDQGQFGVLDPKVLNFKEIKERVEYKRLLYKLDGYKTDPEITDHYKIVIDGVVRSLRRKRRRRRTIYIYSR